MEVLEKGAPAIQGSVMSIIHCLLHYVDMSQATQTINADLLRTVAKFVESPHWKEALKILKLAVTRSSTLVAPPAAASSGVATTASSSAASSLSYHWEPNVSGAGGGGPNFAEADLYFSKKELPGRTMEFTFDLSQTPVIGRRQQPARATFHGYGGGTSTAASTLTGISSLRAAAAAASSSSSASVAGSQATHGGGSSGHHQSSVSSVSAASMASSQASTAIVGDEERDSMASVVISGSSAVRKSMAAAAAAAVQSQAAAEQRQSESQLQQQQGHGGQQQGGATGVGGGGTCLSPKRSLSLTTADSASSSGWKRPWMSQVNQPTVNYNSLLI